MCHDPPVYIEDVTHICVCGKQFEEEEVYIKHKKEVHNEEIVPSYNCGKCDFSTESKEELDSHTDISHKEKEVPSYTCKICNFRTKSTDELDSHIDSAHRNEELNEKSWTILYMWTMWVLNRVKGGFR